MTCKYLFKDFIRKPKEIGDSGLPTFIKMPTCRLYRQPDIVGWANRCENSFENGPCWWWQEEYPQIVDEDFIA